jgi:hypothetical protein
MTRYACPHCRRPLLPFVGTGGLCCAHCDRACRCGGVLVVKPRVLGGGWVCSRCHSVAQQVVAAVEVEDEVSV